MRYVQKLTVQRVEQKGPHLTVRILTIALYPSTAPYSRLVSHFIIKRLATNVCTKAQQQLRHREAPNWSGPVPPIRLYMKMVKWRAGCDVRCRADTRRLGTTPQFGLDLVFEERRPVLPFSLLDPVTVDRKGTSIECLAQFFGPVRVRAHTSYWDRFLQGIFLERTHCIDYNYYCLSKKGKKI